MDREDAWGRGGACMCMYVHRDNQRQKLRAAERGLSAHPHSFFFFWTGGGVGAFLSGLRGVTVSVCVYLRESERGRWKERDRGITGVEGCLDRQSA